MYTLKRAEPNFAEANQIGSEIDSLNVNRLALKCKQH